MLNEIFVRTFDKVDSFIMIRVEVGPEGQKKWLQNWKRSPFHKILASRRIYFHENFQLKLCSHQFIY